MCGREDERTKQKTVSLSRSLSRSLSLSPQFDMATHNIVVFGGDHCGPEVRAI